MKRVSVPDEFVCKIPFQYPAHQRGKLIEEYFLEFSKRKEINSEFCYLPIMWTGYHIKHNWGNDFSAVQEFCDNLPRDKKYFSVVQYDDGVKIDMPNLITFSCCGNKSKVYRDIPIPLLCDRHNEVRKEDSLLASFIGRIGTNVRPEMFSKLSGKDGFFLLDSGDNTTLFLDFLGKSKFALCPRGYGISSFRLYEALEMKSIPVYIVGDEDNFWLPFEEDLDWHKLAILVKESDIYNLPDILGSITNQEISERRQYIDSVYEEYFTMEGCCNQILKSLERIV